MNSQALVREAHDKFEQNDFASACKLFREAALISEPGEGLLGNLSIAEQEERLQFRRELCSRYPDSLNCRLSLILLLDSANRSRFAVRLASETLSLYGMDENNHLAVRLLRLKSTLASRKNELLTSQKNDFLIEDFTYLWNAGTNNAAAYRFRNSIIASFASSTEPSFADTFEDLSRLPFLDEQVAKFLRIKADELRSLGILQQQSS